jgi:thioredoxin 1
MKSIEITDANLKETIEMGGITVLDFWAPWCGPCRMLGPIIEELASTNEDIQVGKVNIDSNGISAATFGIRSIPTIIFFKDGVKVDQVAGVVPLKKIQEMVDKLKEN